MLLYCGVGEKLLRLPWTARRSNQSILKDQSWIFIGRTDAEAEAPVLWTPDVKNWLTRKDPDAGKDWRKGKKGTTKDEIVGWHHWLDGHKFEQAPGADDGQGSLACCSPRGRKEPDMTEWLNWVDWKGKELKIEGSNPRQVPGLYMFKFLVKKANHMFLWLTFKRK